MFLFACSSAPAPVSGPVAAQEQGVEDVALEERQAMRALLQAYGIADSRVLDAMEAVPRHEFVPASLRTLAYADRPLPIGHDQTISQPYVVARMTELVRPQPGDRALDVGTGSGYQAAVLARLVSQVYSIEILCPLAEEAERRLGALGVVNVEVRCGDGWAGWTEQAPFDVIVVAAAPSRVPPALVEQLAPGGRLVIPVGPEGETQQLLLVEKDSEGRVSEQVDQAVRFVPMTGQAQQPP